MQAIQAETDAKITAAQSELGCLLNEKPLEELTVRLIDGCSSIVQ